MENATKFEEFEVTLLTDLDTNLSWTVLADTPDQAMSLVRDYPDAVSGIYSVWDPQDPNGMPLMECTF
jgi:hypothetical protein